MRQLLAMGLALAVIAVASADVEAGSNKRQVKPCPHCGRYHTVQSYGSTTRQKQSLLGRMWEMEQRKNAWLKRTFFGR